MQYFRERPTPTVFVTGTVVKHLPSTIRLTITDNACIHDIYNITHGFRTKSKRARYKIVKIVIIDKIYVDDDDSLYCYSSSENNRFIL